MTIEEITPIDKKRSKIVCENGFYFALYQGEILRLGLKEKGELSEEMYHIQIAPLLKRRIRERIVSILKERDNTEAQLRRKLSYALYPEEIIDKGIEWAKEYRFIDDRRYLEFYIEINYKRKSKKRLIYDLMAKGIAREEIEEALDNIEIEEEEQIYKFLEKKKFFIKEENIQDREKMIRQLIYKGYDFYKIIKCMEKGKIIEE